MMKMTVYVCIFALLSTIAGTTGQSCFSPDENSQSIQCQPVLHNLCGEIGYNMTSLPNIFNHTSQNEAELFLINVGATLFLTDCSAYLSHFLCSAVYPLCFPNKFRQIEPCRELCFSVRESCVPLLQDSGFDWPEELDCGLFASSRNSLCVWTEGNPCKGDNPTPGSDTTRQNENSRNTASANCTGRLILLQNNSRTRFGVVDGCVESCNGVYFENNEQQLLSVWITSWSLVSLFVCVVIFLTYIINFRRVPGLEAPIYYIAVCYAFVALAYTISIAAGKESVICEPQFKNNFNESSLLVDATNHPFCLIIFCVVYYFTLCTWSWWVVCTLEWFVSSIKSKDISNKWRLCFHIIAWCIPLVFTLTALSLGHVTGDPTIKTCWIEKRHELAFLIVPLFAAVLLCSVILVVCFARVVKLQKSHKQTSNMSKNNIKPTILIRTGLYCTLYLLPMGLLLCAYFYEFWYRDEWEKQYLKCSSVPTSRCVRTNSPVFALFMIKITASLIMGIMSVFWIVGRESLIAWRKVCCFCYSSPTHTNSVAKYNVNMNGKYSPTFQIHNIQEDPSNVTSSDSSV